MLLYCDDCGTKNGYDIDTPEKKKGECQLCRRRLGSMNVMNTEDVQALVNGITPDILNVAGFQVQEVEGFPVGTKTEAIEPRMVTHKMAADNCVVFFDPGKIIIANPATGKRFQIQY